MFGTHSKQSSVYDECVHELVIGNTTHMYIYVCKGSARLLLIEFEFDVYIAAFEGFNATIFAYGQTGSGKVHYFKIIVVVT